MHVKSQPFKNKIAATNKGTKAGHALSIQHRNCHQCKGANRIGFILKDQCNNLFTFHGRQGSLYYPQNYQQYSHRLIPQNGSHWMTPHSLKEKGGHDPEKLTVSQVLRSNQIKRCENRPLLNPEILGHFFLGRCNREVLAELVFLGGPQKPIVINGGELTNPL